jgi:NAD(P)-dependent dehydrogenase (short-subunit alcohol dehydrogenase family)
LAQTPRQGWFFGGDGPAARRRVIITGASRGLGRALAESFAAAGASLVVTATDRDRLRDTVAACERLGAPVDGVALDLTDERSIRSAAGAATAALGAVDVLINNAGVLGGTGPLTSYSQEALAQIFAANVIGPVRLVAALADAFAPRAVVINVTSSAAGRLDAGPYGLSKLALDQATRMLREELRGAGVRCVAIDPGAARTRMRAQARPDEDPMSVPPPSTRVSAFLDIAAGADSDWLVRAYEWSGEPAQEPPAERRH